MLQSSRAKSSRSGDSGTIPAIRNRSLTVSHRKYCCDNMKFQGCGQLGLCAISRLVVVSDRKSHITIQHKSRCSWHDSREQARPRPVGHSSKINILN